MPDLVHYLEPTPNFENGIQQKPAELWTIGMSADCSMQFNVWTEKYYTDTNGDADLSKPHRQVHVMFSPANLSQAVIDHYNP